MKLINKLYLRKEGIRYNIIILIGKETYNWQGKLGPTFEMALANGHNKAYFLYILTTIRLERW